MSARRREFQIASAVALCATALPVYWAYRAITLGGPFILFTGILCAVAATVLLGLAWAWIAYTCPTIREQIARDNLRATLEYLNTKEPK